MAQAYLMPITKAFEGRVEYWQILDETGAVDAELEPKLPREKLEQMFKNFILARVFDDKAIKLQRSGRMLTYAPHLGQEAAQIGPVFAMQKEDWMYPAFRENCAYLALGMPAHQLFMYWMGSEEGMKIPEDLNIFTIAIPVASQIPHAAGAAWALKLQKKPGAVVCFFGDGATSEGDFHEGLNFAGVFKVPCVFICQNNQWAISVPRSRQTAAKTIAQKALAYGMDGVLVDGNDVLAMYVVTKNALEKAKRGDGPTLIEAFTYRMLMHTTADDPTKYRDAKEVEMWKKRDPLDRFRNYLKGKKIWSQKWEDDLMKWAEDEVEKAVAKAESFKPSPFDMFDYTIHGKDPAWEEQKAKLKEMIELRKKEGVPEPGG